MKRIIALALTLMMVLSLAACGGKSDSTPSDSASSDASSSAADVKAVKLNLSVPDAESSSIGVAAAEFAKELNEKSRFTTTASCMAATLPLLSPPCRTAVWICCAWLPCGTLPSTPLST